MTTMWTDDGYSGSNFDRPEFKRMIGDIEAGRVNCVIVKDLSRFGRDYIESGRYLEKVNYKVKKSIEKPVEKWVRVENTHGGDCFRG